MRPFRRGRIFSGSVLRATRPVNSASQLLFQPYPGGDTTAVRGAASGVNPTTAVKLQWQRVRQLKFRRVRNRFDERGYRGARAARSWTALPLGGIAAAFGLPASPPRPRNPILARFRVRGGPSSRDGPGRPLAPIFSQNDRSIYDSLKLHSSPALAAPNCCHCHGQCLPGPCCRAASKPVPSRPISATAWTNSSPARSPSARGEGLGGGTR